MAARFQTTRWSVVLAARSGTSRSARAALASLCETYWFPLYAFVRRQGSSADEASDLTQSYFLRLLEKNFLKDVEPSAGRFRSFLLVSLKHFLSNERDRVRALKRGAGKASIPIDTETAERLYACEPTDDLTPDRLFEQRWAMTVLDRVQQRLQQDLEAEGKLELFNALEPYLAGGGNRRPYREIAAQLDISEPAVRMAVLRMRRRYGQLLRSEIAHTLADPDEVDDEIRYLLSIVADR